MVVVVGRVVRWGGRGEGGALERGNLAMGGCCQVKAVIAVVNQIVVKSQALGESDRCVRRSTVERRAFVVFLGAMNSRGQGVFGFGQSDNPKPMNGANEWCKEGAEINQRI